MINGFNNKNTMFTPIKQTDPQWRYTTIGQSKVTIGAKGCLLCSCCMAVEKLRGTPCDPRNAARYWYFAKNGNMKLWETQFKGMKYEGAYSRLSLKIQKEYANNKDRALILRVSSPTIPEHFVFVKSYDFETLIIIDPITGTERDFAKTKYTITSYRLFIKT